MSSLTQEEAEQAKCEASQSHFMYRQFFVTPTAAKPTEIVLSGKTGIVTGANVGLGFEACKQLLALGLSTLVIAVRSEEKGQIARDELIQVAPRADILVWKVDMSSYDSIKAFTVRCMELPRLDFAILNAGILHDKLILNPNTHHDEVVQVNFLSTALLTILLLPLMATKSPSGPGRITIVGSDTAAWAKFKERDSPELLAAFDDPANFDTEDRYYTSKLLQQLFLTQLSERVSVADAVVNTTNPGFCYGSSLHRGVDGIKGSVLHVVKRATGRKISTGARTLVDGAVVQGPESHGKYLGDCKIRPMAPMVYTPEGRKIGERLWKEMEAEFNFIDIPKILGGLKK